MKIPKSLRVAPKWAFGLVAAVLLMAPTVGLLYAGYTSALDFNLASDNSNPRRHDLGRHLLRRSSTAQTIRATPTPPLVRPRPPWTLASHSANSAPRGITWDGTYYRVVDSADDKVYTYTSSGTYTSAQDFDLASANGDPEGMTWDGTYLRVLNRGDDQVYTYTSSGEYTSAQDFRPRFHQRSLPWHHLGGHLPPRCRHRQYAQGIHLRPPSGAYTSA